jgi:hypothetical protein
MCMNKLPFNGDIEENLKSEIFNKETPKLPNRFKDFNSLFER